MSRIPIKYAEMSERGIPKRESLHDPRMGPLEKSDICDTCHGKYSTCPGHFGYIKLAVPVFHVGFMSTVISVLKCVCFKCSRLLLSKV